MSVEPRSISNFGYCPGFGSGETCKSSCCDISNNLGGNPRPLCQHIPCCDSSNINTRKPFLKCSNIRSNISLLETSSPTSFCQRGFGIIDTPTCNYSIIVITKGSKRQQTARRITIAKTLYGLSNCVSSINTCSFTPINARNNCGTTTLIRADPPCYRQCPSSRIDNERPVTRDPPCWRTTIFKPLTIDKGKYTCIPGNGHAT